MAWKVLASGETAKWCNACKQWLKEADYQPYAWRSHGQCRRCRLTFTPEQIARRNERSRERYRTNAKARQYRTDFQLRRYYGITLAERDALIESQDGKCAVCEVPFDDNVPKRRPCTDHVEVDGEIVVRGILCHCCNTGIGALGDDVAGLLRALKYLESR